MPYECSFRKRVLKYVSENHTKKETCELFGISTNTLYLWEKQLAERGYLERKPRVSKPRKLPIDQLKQYVAEHPDAFLREIAAHFGCSVASVWSALKKHNITLKKTSTYNEQDEERGRQYLEVLSCFPDTPVVYIDETGIDTNVIKLTNLSQNVIG